MIRLQVQNISKRFDDNQVINNCSVEINAHETVSILGRSGCGKTTFLKTIAGIHNPDEGAVLLNGNDIHQMIPHKRGVVYLYQEALLFPHLSVLENIAFGLKVQNLPKAEVQDRVSEMIESIGLSGKEDQMPHELSGGQKQRVAFGRALIINPEVLLLDEPFGSLDVETRAAMQSLFKRVADKYEITSLFVTHDLKEAILIGDRIAVMDKGDLQVFDSREEFMQSPVSGVKEEQAFWNSL